MKRILFIDFTDVYGGGEVYLERLINYKQKNVKKILLSPNKRKMIGNLDKDIIVEKGKVRASKFFSIENIFNIFYEVFLIYKLIKKYDIEYIFFNGKDSYQLSPFIFKKNITKIGIWHGIVQGEDFFRKLLNQLSFKSLDKIISICEYQKKVLLKTFGENIIDKSKIKVIKLGVEVDNYFKNISNNKKIKLGIVARLELLKGHSDLIEVIKKLQEKKYEVELFIAGEGKEKEKIIKSIVENNLEKNVKLLGFINPRELLAELDIFILPSYNEAFPLSILEAMASGLPIISTKVGGIPEMISDKNGILISPGSIEDMYFALEKLILNKEERIKLGLNSKKIVEKNFNLKKINKETYDYIFGG